MIRTSHFCSKAVIFSVQSLMMFDCSILHENQVSQTPTEKERGGESSPNRSLDSVRTDVDPSVRKSFEHVVDVVNGHGSCRDG